MKENGDKEARRIKEGEFLQEQVTKINLENEIFSKEELLNLLKKYDEYILEFPEEISGYGNRSIVLERLELYELAISDLKKVINCSDLTLAHLRIAFIYLKIGKMQEGWKNYEWRRMTSEFNDNNFINIIKDVGLPYWNGEKIDENNKLFVYQEQGLGDSIQFFRFLLELKKRGISFSVLYRPELDNLFRYNLEKYGIEIHENGEKLKKEAKYQVLSMSLPNFLKIYDLKDIPYKSKYLEVPLEFNEKWQKKLKKTNKKRIGIFWGSDSKFRNKFRNVSFDKINKLFSFDADFHCLQKNVVKTDKEVGKKYKNLYFWDDELDDFCDTAALIEQMDLIITVDTSVAHLAGAMGKKTWIMLSSYTFDFRWLLNRKDSPWYDSVRLFRQDENYKWDNVIEEITEELQKII